MSLDIVAELVRVYLAHSIDGDNVITGTIEEVNSDWVVINDDGRVLYINKDYIIAIEPIND